MQNCLNRIELESMSFWFIWLTDWVENKRPSATKPTGEIHLSCFLCIQNKFIHFKLVQKHFFTQQQNFGIELNAMCRIRHVQYLFVNFPFNSMVKCMRIVIMNACIATMTNENHNQEKEKERERERNCRIREFILLRYAPLPMSKATHRRIHMMFHSYSIENTQA